MQINYFKFSELVHTTKSIANIPDWEAVENLHALGMFLDKIRAEFRKPIRVNSAFRSPELNTAVGGSKTSAHLRGLAADICAWSGTEADNRLLLCVLEKHQSEIDQLIAYHKIAGNEKSALRFVHVGLCQGVPRAQRMCK